MPRSGTSEDGGRFRDNTATLPVTPSERAASAFKCVHRNSTLFQGGHNLEMK